jgi:poly(ADP-ribose) glycohydrolase
VKPELIVAMALSSFMHDEEAISISGAIQFSCYSGYASTFEFVGDYDCRREGQPSTVVAMDALQGAKHRQFEQGLVLRDLNKGLCSFTYSTDNTVPNGLLFLFTNVHEINV